MNVSGFATFLICFEETISRFTPAQSLCADLIALDSSPDKMKLNHIILAMRIQGQENTELGQITPDTERRAPTGHRGF